MYIFRNKGLSIDHEQQHKKRTSKTSGQKSTLDLKLFSSFNSVKYPEINYTRCFPLLFITLNITISVTYHSQSSQGRSSYLPSANSPCSKSRLYGLHLVGTGSFEGSSP